MAQSLQERIDLLKWELQSGNRSAEDARRRINALRAQMGKPPLSDAQFQRISTAQSGGDAAATPAKPKINTGVNKRGLVNVKTDEEVTQGVSQSIDDALSAGGKFRDLLKEGSFETVDDTRSSEMAAYLARQKELAGEASGFSEREDKALSEMEEGLKGYDSEEVQAMREAAMAEIDRNLKTANYQNAIQQARAGVSGGAALAAAQDMQLQAMEGKRGIERDLVIQNAQEALNRKQAFANAVRGAEDARWNRTQGMEYQYGSFLGADEQALRNAQQFNATQRTNEALARAGLTLEGAGIYTGQLNSAQANQLAQQNVNSQVIQNRINNRFTARQNEAMLAANQYAAQVGANAITNAAKINADANIAIANKYNPPPASTPPATSAASGPVLRSSGFSQTSAFPGSSNSSNVRRRFTV